MRVRARARVRGRRWRGRRGSVVVCTAVGVSASMGKNEEGDSLWIYMAYQFAVLLAYGGERSWRKVFVKLKLAELAKVGDERLKYVATTSHDLRTPMNAFQLGLDILAEGGLADDESRNVVGVMQEAAHIMANTVDNLLIYSRSLTQ
eukprot:jgi/Mesen1/9614/ME000659S08993